MLTREEDIDAHALRKRGWSITAIAAHLGRDRKTIRAYLEGQRIPGVRARPVERQAVLTASFREYLSERLVEDPHVWATTLFDEVQDLGYIGSYPTLVRTIRELRPVCTACRTTKTRPTGIIAHPPGEETQWDWLELPDPPQWWGWTGTAHLLVGTLSCSGKWRAALLESEDQAHLIAGLDRVSRALGGLSRVWRFDRMATVCHPSSGKVTASFAAVAKHYEVQVAICPPFAGNRKGAVEKANHSAAQRVWRNVRDDMSVEAAQAKFDDWCRTKGDLRVRKRPEFPKDTIIELAKKEPLRPVPTEMFPAITTVERIVSSQALVSYAGNFYSVAPDHVRTKVFVHTRLGSGHIDITTTEVPPVVLARHRLEPAGAGAIIRTDTHISALSSAVLAATAGRRRAHNRKERIPPGPAAQAAADKLRTTNKSSSNSSNENRSVVIDLSAYAKAAEGRNTL